MTAASRLPYDDAVTPSQMTLDARATRDRLHLDPPSLRYEDFPTDRPKREMTISEAAARLAGSLHLHLD